jgi:hypothetical protein
MTLFRGRKNVVALAPAFVGIALLMHSMGGGQRPINGAEAQQIFGGVATCNVGAQLNGNMDCLGACANNPVYGSVGANGTTTKITSCGTCGGNYTGSQNCPIPINP